MGKEYLKQGLYPWIEIPGGAEDSELKGWEYTIPEGMEAEIGDGKIVVRKKQPELTLFEQHLLVYFQKVYYAHCESQDVNDFLIGTIKQSSKSLLELAKKEICTGCTVGLDQYWKGRDDARKEAEKPITYHFPTYWPPCYHGGVCTNPMKDCINCPRTGGDIGISTTSGTCKKD